MYCVYLSVRGKGHENHGTTLVDLEIFVWKKIVKLGRKEDSFAGSSGQAVMVNR